MPQHYNTQWLANAFENGQCIEFLFFWGHTNSNNEEAGKFCLSQWYPSPFTVNGVEYKTAEHWMMAQKALLFEDKEMFEKIIMAETPSDAKKLGRLVKGFDDAVWNNNRFDIVTQGSIHKFNQNQAFGKYLLGTGGKVLVEAAPRDTIWGIGLGQDNERARNVKTWRGLNLLGFALMEARDFIQKR
jgi:ribA/ribD-fused uncharacterized protein